MDLKINLENCLYFLYNKIYFTIEIFYKRNNFIGSIIIQYPIVFVLKRKDLRFCVSHFFSYHSTRRTNITNLYVFIIVTTADAADHGTTCFKKVFTIFFTFYL